MARTPNFKDRMNGHYLENVWALYGWLALAESRVALAGIKLPPYPSLRQLLQPADPGSERIWTDICKTESDVVGAAAFLPYTDVSYLFPKTITAKSKDSA
jgi:hypothetical protein